MVPLVLALVLGIHAAAEDWSRFRGPNGSAISTSVGLPMEFAPDVGVVWKYHKSVPQLPSPLVYKDVLYIVNDGGIVTTLKPATGEVIAQSRVNGAVDRFYASPIAADNKVFLFSEKGKVAVLPTDGSLKPLVVNDLQDDVYATPAISDGRIYVRTRSTLYCFGIRR